VTSELINNWAVPAGGGLLGLVCLLYALRAGRRLRLVENTPTSKTTGVFIGLVEITGTAEAEQPLTSTLTGSTCVYYEWTVEEHWSKTVTEHYTDSKGRSQTRTRRESGWTTVASGGDSTPFYLQDDAGVILVRPDGAMIEPQGVMHTTVGREDPLYYGKGPDGAIAHSDHRRRFTEKIIALHAPLYIMGQAREREDIVAAEIARDPQAEMFLISTRSEQQVGSGLRGAFWGLGLLGLIFTAAGFAVRTYMQQRDWSLDLDTWLSAGGSFLGAWMIGSVWMMYNSLVGLRARVRQAWANVDVQLKRRNDLIPRLVEITRAFRDYEHNLQAELAHLRAQLTATAPGQPGPDPRACAGQLAVIVERYPELKANELFLTLQRCLVDTENRISLARGYFNDIATFYNTRLTVIPDRFITALGAMRPAILMTADDFERKPIRVNLAS
jgi:hypothetical protein